MVKEAWGSKSTGDETQSDGVPLENGLRAMGINMDAGRLESLQRVGGSKVLESLQDLGTYFEQQNESTASTPAATPRTSQGRKVQSSVSCSPQNKALSAADGAEDHRKTKTSKEERPEASIKVKEPSKRLPKHIENSLHQLQEKYSSDPYKLYSLLRREENRRVVSPSAFRSGLVEAGITLSKQDYGELLKFTSDGTQGVDVGNFVRAVTGLESAKPSSSSEAAQELRKECAKSKAAKEEQRLERLIRKTIRDKDAASVDIFLKRDQHRTGKLNQASFIDAVNDLGINLAKEDINKISNLFSRDEDGNIFYANLVNDGKKSVLKQKGGVEGFVQRDPSSKWAYHMVDTMRNNHGSVTGALKSVFGNTNASAVSRSDLRSAFATLGFNFGEEDFKALTSEMGFTGGTPKSQLYDLEKVSSQLEKMEARLRTRAIFAKSPKGEDHGDDRPRDESKEEFINTEITRCFNRSDRMRRILTCSVEGSPGPNLPRQEPDRSEEPPSRSKSAPCRAFTRRAAGARSEDVYTAVNPNRQRDVAHRRSRRKGVRGEILKALVEGREIPSERNDDLALKKGHEIFGPHTTKRRALIRELVTDHIKDLLSSTVTSQEDLKGDSKNAGRTSKADSVLIFGPSNRKGRSSFPRESKENFLAIPEGTQKSLALKEDSESIFGPSCRKKRLQIQGGSQKMAGVISGDSLQYPHNILKKLQSSRIHSQNEVQISSQPNLSSTLISTSQRPRDKPSMKRNDPAQRLRPSIFQDMQYGAE